MDNLERLFLAVIYVVLGAVLALCIIFAFHLMFMA